MRRLAAKDHPGPPSEFKQITGSTSSECFNKSEFFGAVDLSRAEIANASTDDELLDLWAIRLQSLLILEQGQQAAEEITKNFGKFEELDFEDPHNRLRLWKLRAIGMPVRTKGLNQSAVQQYYNLAYEARQNAQNTTDAKLREEWLQCVYNAGIYAVSTLVALKDYVTAIELLKQQTPSSQVAELLALLYISVGDTLGASPWIDQVQDHQEVLKQLAIFADDDSRSAEIGGIGEVYRGDIEAGFGKLADETVNDKSVQGVLNSVKLANLEVLYHLCYNDGGERIKLLRARLLESQNTHLESTSQQINRILTT